MNLSSESLPALAPLQLALAARRHRLQLEQESLKPVAPASIEYPPIIQPGEYDFKNPDYGTVFRKRREALEDIRSRPEILPALRRYYRDRPAQFISDWGCTFDTRNVAVNRPAHVPFILFPRQTEFVDWIIRLWRASEPGLADKSRDAGISWVTGALAATLCLFMEGVVIGFGSRKEDLIDNSGDPDCQFWKIRYFIASLPEEFKGDWTEKKYSKHMRIGFPGTDSIIKGEAGDNIGRGGRASIYMVDEAAHLPRPDLVDFALSQTTRCRIDFSSVKGRANPFAQKRWSWPAHRIFTFHWRQDPRKDQAWYEAEREKINNPVIVAQEIDIDYAASMEGGIIPSAWIEAAVDAHVKLNITPTGDRFGALDVADEGQDLNAFCGAHGILVDFIDEWTGKGSDIYSTVSKTFLLCDMQGYDRFRYDADGLGSGVRGDARIINEKREDKKIEVEAFRGSEAVTNPTGEDVKGRKNEDFFENRKAQAWWALRTRFQNTHRAVVDKLPYDAANIISLSSNLKNLVKLISELSQPTYTQSKHGKLMVEKMPDGARSPNMADSVMMRMATGSRTAMKISNAFLARI